MNKSIIDTAKEFAFKCHSETNHTYDGEPYSFHLVMAAQWASKFSYLIPHEEFDTVMCGVFCHDLCEDTRVTYNDVRKVINKDAAEIVYALTNEKGKNRKERANEKYYQGIRKTQYAMFVKLCDRLANSEHSFYKWTKDGISAGSMYEKYQAENENFIWSLIKPEWHHLGQQILKLIIGKKNYIESRIIRHDYSDMIYELRTILEK